jgi:hypothetical protein
MKLTQQQVLGIIRHILTFGGGILVTKGLLDEGMVSEISGAVITLIGAVWSIIEKSKAA